MVVNVLGPLALTVGGDRRELGNRKPVHLLAVLCAHAGPVRAERLADEVWPDRPAGAARELVKNAVGQLNRDARRRDGGPLVTSVASLGYRLAVDTDAARFDTMVRTVDADPAVRCDHLRAALGLWRGPSAYEGFDDLPSVASEARRLDELRIHATEAQLEAELALGRHAEVLAELTRVVAEHPLHEGFAALHALALYRSGRQAEALRALERIRIRLVDELGVSPGARLRDLEAAVLRHDPALAVPAPLVLPAGPDRTGSPDAPGAPTGRVAPDRPAGVPPMLAAVRSGPFVGRDAAVDALLERPAGGFAVVEGPPGVGKTRVLAEVAHRLADRGELVAHGWSTPELELPYEPLVSLVRGLGPSAGPVLELLRTADAHLPAAAARHRALDALCEALGEFASRRPVRLVVDDVQWLDHASALALRYLRRRLPPGVGVLVAARDREPSATTHWRAVADDLSAAGAPWHRLSGLDEAATVALCRQASGNPELAWGTARRIHVVTGGTPLYVLAALRDGADGLRTATWTARRAIAARADAVSDDDRAVLCRAAVAGPVIVPRVVAAACSRPLGDVEDVLGRCARAGLVHETVPDCFVFDHEVLRQVLVDELTAAERRRVHQTVATVLAGDAAVSPVEPVRHRLAGAVGAARAAAITDAARIAADVAGRNDHDTAARLFGMAVAAADEAVTSGETGPQDLGRLVLGWAQALDRSGELDAAMAAAQRAFDLAEAAGDLDALADAALVGEAHSTRIGGDPARRARLEWAIARVRTAGNDPVRLARLLHWHAFESRLARLPVDFRALRAELDALYERCNDDLVDAIAAFEAYAEAAYDLCSDHPPQTLLAAVQRLATAAARIDDPSLRQRIHEAITTGHIALGDLDGAARALDRHGALVARARLPRGMWMDEVVRAGLALARGDLDQAAQRSERARALADRLELPDGFGAWAVHEFVARYQGAGVGPLVDLLAAVALGPGAPKAWTAGYGLALVDCGRLAEARGALATTVRALSDDPSDSFDEIGWAMAADLAARLHDAGAAQRCHEALRRRLGRFVVVAAGVATVGPVARYLGLTAAAAGDCAAALGFFDEAVDAANAAGAEPWAARAREDRTRLLGADPATPHTTRAAAEGGVRG